MRWNHWAVLGLGAWLVVSPWLLGFSELNLPTWNNIIAGSLAAVLALWSFAPPRNP